MRRALKFLHTVAAAGILGALACYMIILLYAPQDTPRAYADARATIDAISSYLLLPSLGIALISGLLSMVAHRPFQDMRWVWMKALLGISMFEGTLAIVHAKATEAAQLSEKIANGEPASDALAAAIASEWMTLYAILALSVANYVLGIWRPALAMRWVVK